MCTPAQIEASRRNGARSRGPATPQGKAVARLNSTRHGLLSQTVVMSGEDATQFRNLLQDFVRRIQPADAVELTYVEQMVAAIWRLHRAEAIEVAILNRLVGAPVEDPRLDQLAAATPDLEGIRRYQQCLLRDHHRAAKDLAELRANHPDPEPEPEPVPYEPKPPCQYEQRESTTLPDRAG